jgi:ribosome biogenesis GTPase
LLLQICRVCAHDRGSYLIATGAAELRAGIDGALRHAAACAADFPVVGDYVAAEIRPGESAATIRRIVPRANLFTRRAAGGAGTAQPIAANIDTLCIAVAVGADFNLRRIERYLVAAAACGVPAAIALTKADLAADLESYRTAAAAVAGDSPVLALRALEPGGLAEMDALCGPGRTIAIVGSSGVGKSTLVNALAGETRVATSAIRASDGRGRHTTTRRELLWLADGTALIDTPGMREFALADAEDGVAEAFDDIAALAANCRFRDCRHAAEPGCAVRAGLDAERLANWERLRREAAFEARKTDPAAARREKQRWKAIGMANRKRKTSGAGG